MKLNYSNVEGKHNKDNLESNNEKNYYEPNTNVIQMIANVNFLDNKTQDIYIMYFDTEDSIYLNAEAKENESNHSRHQKKSYDEDMSKMSNISFAKKTETYTSLNIKYAKQNSKEIVKTKSSSFNKFKQQIVDIKTDSVKPEISQKQIIFNIISMTLLIAVLVLFIVSYVLTINCQTDNSYSRNLYFQYSEVNTFLLKTVFYTRKLDYLYNQPYFNSDLYSLYIDELNNTRAVFQNNTRSFIYFQSLYIIDNVPSLQNVYVEYVLSDVLFSDNIYPVNAYFKYITSTDNIINDKYHTFNISSNYSDLYFLIKNGINGLYVNL